MLCLDYYAYGFSSTKLEVRFCLEVKGKSEKRLGKGVQGEEMTQTIYVHVNK
jgi:hypothetical protein